MLRELLRAAAHIISPNVCQICSATLSEGEEVLCTDCLMQMPRTHLHLSDFNIIHQRLGTSARIDRAAAWFYYTKQSAYARLIVDTKYSARPLQGRKLGEIYARETAPDGLFNGVDCLVPVPMHFTKRLLRGYNQTEEICRGITRATGIPWASLLAAPESHGVQSRHTADQRRAAIKGTFACTDTAPAHDGEHLMIVDDIITTGSTMLEAVENLRAACPHSPISVLALATTI